MTNLDRRLDALERAVEPEKRVVVLHAPDELDDAALDAWIAEHRPDVTPNDLVVVIQIFDADPASVTP